MAKRTQRKAGIVRRPQKRRWTLLAYIAADNNLSDAGLKDIREMCKEGSAPHVHVGVEIDTYGAYTGSIRYEITEPDWTGRAHRIVIQRLPEKDSGDPLPLTDFLRWGLKRYPAQNRLVVVWNHGAGFRAPRRDIGYDDFGSSLNMPEIEKAFSRSGINAKNRLQIVGFDACLMNMLEVVHHFHNQVEIVVGSQQTEPGDGWPYDHVLKRVKSARTGKELAHGIVGEYMADYRRMGVANVTQSAVLTAGTQAVVRAVSNLGGALLRDISGIRDDIRAIRVRTQSFHMADYVDLIHLARLIEGRFTDTRIRAAARDVVTATRACILVNGKSGSSVQNANGLSIWFPASASLYSQNRAKYMELKCNAARFRWTDFLDAYHT